MKGLVTRDTHVQYESPTSSGLKVMAKVKVFSKVGQTLMSRSEGQNYGTLWKVLSQEIHMCKIKALPLLVWKLWPRLKFFKSRSNFNVKVAGSKIMVPCERSCQKEYACNMKVLPLIVWKLWPRLKFFKSRSNFKVKVTRSKIMLPCERSC